MSHTMVTEGSAMPPPEEAIASIRGLVKTYGSAVAVAGIDLDVPTGSVLGLVGPNGSGKTTTMSVLVGLLRPTDGRVRVCGLDPTTDSKAVRRRVGYMPDVLGFHDGLLVHEYLDFFAAAHDVPKRDRPARIDGLLELVELTDRRNARVDALSRGLKQRLSLARALTNDPDLLILDEPASGLDPRARVDLRDTLAHLRELGKTIIISSHILGELESMCTDLAVISAGRVQVAGPSGDLLRGSRGERTVEVRLATGEVQQFAVVNDREQAELVRRLIVDEGLPVMEVSSAGSDLERLFLEVTVDTPAQEQDQS